MSVLAASTAALIRVTVLPPAGASDCAIDLEPSMINAVGTDFGAALVGAGSGEPAVVQDASARVAAMTAMSSRRRRVWGGMG